MPEKLRDSSRASDDFSFWYQSGNCEVMLYYISDVTYDQYKTSSLFLFYDISPMEPILLFTL